MLKRSVLRLLLLIIFIAAALPAAAEPDYDAVVAQFERYIDGLLADTSIVGISVAFQHGDHYWDSGYGWADLENMVPMKADAMHRYASISKPICAVGILKLYDMGKIDLDAEIQTYVPDFPKKKWPVTVRQILGHLSGVSHYKNFQEESNTIHRFTTAEALDIFDDWELRFEPGTAYGYTTYGYTLLVAAIENVSGQSYEEFMREHVWGPAGMDHVRTDNLREIIPNRVEGYDRVDGKLVNSRPVSISMKVGGGGLRGTAGDLVRFAQAMDDGAILKPETVEMMWTSMMTGDNRFTNYGMGWGVGGHSGRFRVNHSGGQDETSTLLFHYPAHDLTVAVCCNYEQANDMGPTYRLTELLFGDPVGVPSPYFSNTTEEDWYRALQYSYRDGFSYYDYYREMPTTDLERVEASFTYLANTCALAEAGKAAEADSMLSNGRHPIAGVPFGHVGAYIASTMADAYGPGWFDEACGRSVPMVFAEYVRWYRSQSGYPEALTLPDDVADRVVAWAAAWEELDPKPFEQLALVNATDIAARAEELKQAWSDAPIRPNYVGDIEAAAEAEVEKGNGRKAMALAQAGIELYPESDRMHTFFGALMAYAGRAEVAEKHFKLAAKLDPGGAASAGGLNLWAYRLKNFGATDAAIIILSTAIELYPQNANLHDSMGEMYMDKGQYAKSIEWYEKAIELDPEFENPKKMIKRVQALQAGG